MIMQNFHVIIWHIHKYRYFIIIKFPLFKAFFESLLTNVLSDSGSEFNLTDN